MPAVPEAVSPDPSMEQHLIMRGSCQNLNLGIYALTSNPNNKGTFYSRRYMRYRIEEIHEIQTPTIKLQNNLQILETNTLTQGDNSHTRR